MNYNKAYELHTGIILCKQEKEPAMNGPKNITARTGEKCPASGQWTAIGYPGSSAPIAIGNRMPPYKDSAVTWNLVRKL